MEITSPDFYHLQAQTGWARILARFARWCAPLPEWRVLDAGSGPGYLAAVFTKMGNRAIALDLELTNLYPERLHPLVVQADLLFAPFQSRSFDLIAAANVLFLLPDPLPALYEFRRLLPENGKIGLLNPSEQMSQFEAQALADAHQLQGAERQSLLYYARQAEKHSHWTLNEIENILAGAGLLVERTHLTMGPGLVRFVLAGNTGFSNG
jgi:SAM-dependent methyltransferase